MSDYYCNTVEINTIDNIISNVRIYGCFGQTYKAVYNTSFVKYI